MENQKKIKQENRFMRPYILVTNDDGYEANGIKKLIEVMCEIGDVVVVSPTGPRSGTSNALTVHQPIWSYLIQKEDKLTIYTCSGTPTDCVKLAFHTLVERKPDLVVSGINHGSNAAINVIYSGTMGAVLEGCAYGIPSIGFSLCDHEASANFDTFLPFIKKIALQTLKKGLPNGVCLNVNAPKDDIKGIKIARQCNGNWGEEFIKQNTPWGEDFYWLTGKYNNREPAATDTDEWALNNGYISIVPTKIDLTAYDFIDKIKEWKF